MVELVLRIGMAFLLPFLWLQPSSYFDTGEERCYWKVHYGIECPGCGLTRGTQRMLHGEWQTAMELNPLSGVVAGALLVVWALNGYELYRIIHGLPNLNTPTRRRLSAWFESILRS
ncbi:MAG: DUF2752 domain-containing protein [Bacteroidia bacterium]|nr:DUF2752 domain-containing protein [Bacteroidia bacterium]